MGLFRLFEQITFASALQRYENILRAAPNLARCPDATTNATKIRFIKYVGNASRLSIVRTEMPVDETTFDEKKILKHVLESVM